MTQSTEQTFDREEFLARLKALDADEIRAQSEAYMKQELVTPDRIYVDLALMKDLRLGAAMHLRMDQLDTLTTIEALRQANHKYRTRDFYDVPYYFPMLQITNDEIDCALKDPTQSDAIFAAAFPTRFCDSFNSHIRLNVNHNTAAGRYATNPTTKALEPIPIRVFINTWPLRLSKRSIFTLGTYVAKRYGVDAQIGCVDPVTYPLDEFLQWEEHYLFYLKEYIERPDIADAYLTGRMIKSRLFGLRYCGNTVDPRLTSEMLNTDMVITKSTLDVLSTFYFIEPSIVTPIFTPSSDGTVPKD